MKERRTAQDTREQLLTAAAEEFAQHGPQGARVQEIVRRAGINERMIYHYFGSKDGLYRATLEDQWHRLEGAWQPALGKATALKPLDGLRLAFQALFQVIMARPLFLSLAMHEAMSGWNVLPVATFEQLPSSLRTLYERGQQEGVLRVDYDFELFYLTALGSLAAIVLFAPRFQTTRERLQRDPAFAEQLCNQMVSLLLEGVAMPGV